METRRKFIGGLFVVVSTALTALLAVSCGPKPDAETEPSPEWPPKEEK